MKYQMNKTDEVKTYFYNPTIDEFYLDFGEQPIPDEFDTIVVDRAATAQDIDDIFLHIYE